MQIGPLQVTFHRTVRVADGRTPANLPPSLGFAQVHRVADFRAQCPDSWDPEGVFLGLHDTEALWISFSTPRPLAVLVGAGGINALTGEPLALTLAAGNYMVAPPQPWIDGWKAEDGRVYQFVATPYLKGDGLSVAEQLIGAESKSGGIGIAVFESTAPLAPKAAPITSQSASAYGDTTKGLVMRGGGGAHGMSLSEMGVGKGGQIKQKIYPDPYGLEAWKTEPAAAMAVYLVDAKALAELTGKAIPAPVTQEEHLGPWYDVADEAAGDLPGSAKFTGLNTVFAAGQEEPAD